MRQINFIQNSLNWVHVQRVISIMLFLVVLFDYRPLTSQCNPPPAETCEEANLFCSLDDMNGFSCNTPSLVQSTCSPGCGLWLTSNRTWWAFVCQGGNVSITFSVGACTVINNGVAGLEFGIWGDCHCGEKIICATAFLQTNNSETYQVNLIPCKKYYISIDSGDDNCDFTISTSGGGTPSLFLGHINNVPNDIIEPVCVGHCGYKFFVDQGGCLEAIMEWTLDGNKVGDTKNELKLDFPDQGDFKLCVTATLGSPKICAQQGPACTTVKVRPLADRIGASRTICYETANPKGYKWLSQTIYNSGIYREHYADNNCCKYDSVVQFTVLPEIDRPDVYYISCDNKPFVDALGHKWSPCLDRFTINLPKTVFPFKCDSAIRLTAINVDFLPQWQARCAGSKVELTPNIVIPKKCSVGESYKFDYKWYKKNDTVKVTISTDDHLLVDTINEDYCLDVRVKIHLGTDSTFCIRTFCDTINEADSKNTVGNINLSFCDSAMINGQKYTQSTQFKQQLVNVFGCDSIVNTEISIQKSSKSDLVIKACDSMIVNNQVYYQSGKYAQTLVSSNNCDSILNIDLNLGKSNHVDLAISVCDSLVVNGKTIYQSGLYSQLLQNLNFCDSTVNLNITISKSPQDSFSFNACDTVFFNGKTYTKSGAYPESFISSNGCDSIVNIQINITNSNTSPYIVSYCDSVTINGNFFDQSGSYTQKLKSANGCDSLLNIELTIGKNNSSNYKLTLCDSALINSQWYFQSGIYKQILQNFNQCDSTLNIDLNITKSSSGDTLFRSCDSVTVNGQTYRQTGIYKQTLTNFNQCDSTLIIDFIRLSKSSTTLNYQSCDSVVVNNQIYKQSGNYTQTFVNANQCDSILNLDVTVTKSNSSISNMSGCDSVSVNGQTYNQSGNYIQNLTNAGLCDSLLNINLTIFKSSSINYDSKSCDSVTINGKTFYQSGNYTQYLKDANLCDSTIYIQLTINNSTKGTLSKTACDSILINGTSYYITGSYLQNLINSNSCDSTLTLDLIIKPGNPSTLDAGTDTSICDGEVIQLNGIFSGQAKFTWHSTNGILDNPNNLSTNYYSSSIGDERIYLQASDDCKQWLDSFVVHVLPKQIVQVTGDTILNPCKEISFTASGGTNYIWTPSSVIECLDPACSRVKLKSTATLRFTISSLGPCVVPANLNLSLSQIQTDVYLPNVFSPNGDNINDVFLPIFNCDQLDFYNLQIFDRWGNLVFESTTKEKGWNGKYQDVNMNPGVYPYVIQYQLHGAERKVKAGDITLVK